MILKFGLTIVNITSMYRVCRSNWQHVWVALKANSVVFFFLVEGCMLGVLPVLSGVNVRHILIKEIQMSSRHMLEIVDRREMGRLKVDYR